MTDLTYSDVQAKIHRMDPNLSEDDEVFDVACLLLSSTIVGPNKRRLRSFTGLSREFIDRTGHLLRRNGVWRAGKVYGDWDDEDTGGIAFWTDVCIGAGLMERSRS